MKSTFNIIADSPKLRQGSNVYLTPLIEALRTTYFESEPRTTIYWLKQIKWMSERIPSTATGTDWNDLIPPLIPIDLLDEYIKDPVQAIKNKRFTKEEIVQLRQPQRIMLFYFLKKLAAFEDYNESIIRRTNNLISKDLFQIKQLPATPDYGFVLINSEENKIIEIPRGEIIDALVEGELGTRKYVTTAPLIGNTITLDTVITASPVSNENALNVVHYSLPLQEKVQLFKQVRMKDAKAVFSPSLIISSSLLSLAEGYREIHLSLISRVNKDSNSETYARDKSPFEFSITTAEGWKELESVEYHAEQKKEGLVNHSYVFRIQPEWPAVVPLCGHLEGEEELANCLQQNAQINMCLTDNNGLFQVFNIELHVMVKGLVPSVLRNQDQVIDPNDNYNPFGLEAPRNAVFGFGHRELADRKLEEISLTPSWVEKPKDINFYYEAYNLLEVNFKVKISSVYKNSSTNTHEFYEDGEKKLFDPSIIFTPKYPIAIQGTWLEGEPDPLAQALSFQMELSIQGFGHSRYPLLMADYTIAKSIYDNMTLRLCRKAPLAVRMPYIPQFAGLSISYKSSNATWSTEGSSELIEVFRKYPLGYSTYKGGWVDLGEDKNGVLYLGIPKVLAGSASSIYFHGPPGDSSAASAKVEWKFLSTTGWLALPSKHILYDGTHGLTQSGVFYWETPPEIVDKNTLMPEGLFWLKVVVKPETIPNDIIEPNQCCTEKLAYTDSIMRLNGVFANGFPIKRMEENLNASENKSFMPAGTTLYFENSDFQLSLPYNTVGNVAAEGQLNYWARVFNRIRNRGRMVDRDDFENLILYHFRELILVKCISRVSCSNYVEVVVIAKINPLDLRNLRNSPPFLLPMVPKHSLKKIEETMVPFASPFFRFNTKLKVSNPSYIRVGFVVQVKFKGGSSDTENRLRLHSDLQRFVSPWFFSEDKIPSFGCKFDYGEVLAFLQGKGYIFAIYNIKLGIIEEGKLTFPQHFQFKENEIMIIEEPSSIIMVDDSTEFLSYGIGKEIIEIDFYVTEND
ncbi:MAG: hypothetical protein JKY48_00760 [Flavobacteriales bacterium]|nr:hypothetical protein [Flavobacteriales bacterium]